MCILNIVCIFVKQNTKEMENQVKTKIRISELEVGMTVEYKGQLLTIGKNDVFKNEFGLSFRGDSSIKEITRVQFAVPTAFGVVLR